MPDRAIGTLWGRGLGVVLRATTLDEAIEACPTIEQALHDGIGRRHEGPLPELPPGTECFLVRAGGEHAGLLTVRRDHPATGTATVGVAIVPERRGGSLGIRAVFAAERRLRRDGVRAFQASAPRSNGHGMYFWLRVGYVPLRGDDRGDGATWFELPRRRRRRRPRWS